jgi:hypothetical protein
VRPADNLTAIYEPIVKVMSRKYSNCIQILRGNPKEKVYF